MNYDDCSATNRLRSVLELVTQEDLESADYAQTTGSPSGDAASKKTV